MKLNNKTESYADDFDDGFNDDFDFRDNNYINDGFSNDFGFGGGDVLPMDKHQDLLKRLTNFEPYLRNMIAEWLGLIWSTDDNKYVKDPDSTPIMNVVGAKWCINYLTPYARDNNILTSLDRETFKFIIEDCIDTAIFNVGCRAEEFGIKSDGDCMKVWNQLIHSVLLVLVGASTNNNYKTLLQQTIHRNESINLSDFQGMRQMPPKKSSFLNNLKSKLLG